MISRRGKGESDGHEAAVSKPFGRNYQTTSLSTPEQVMTISLIGLESGKYDIGNEGAWYTKNVPRNLSFQKNQSASISISPSGKKMRTNTRTSMTSKENWLQFHHKMHNGMLKEYNEHKDQQIELTAANFQSQMPGRFA